MPVFNIAVVTEWGSALGVVPLTVRGSKRVMVRGSEESESRERRGVLNIEHGVYAWRTCCTGD